jgi:cold shock CspA family protein
VQVTPEIVLRGMEMTPYIDKLVTRGMAKLEQVSGHIISTRIALEQAQGRRQSGNPYQMRIEIRISERPEVVVKRSSKALKRIPDGTDESQTEVALKDEAQPERSQLTGRRPVRKRGMQEEPLPALIRRTFDSARRELEKVVDKQHGEVKTPAQQDVSAVVEKIIREKEYGFLRTTDGQQVYFHRNSMLHNHLDRLTVGTVVRYTLEMGEKGLQASTVEPVGKPGVAEAHGQLHDLPQLSTPRKSTVRGRRSIKKTVA